jgi:hypothetical protein
MERRMAHGSGKGLSKRVPFGRYSPDKPKKRKVK